MLKRWRKSEESAATLTAHVDEGFVCPICLVRLASPEALQQHYAHTHDQSAGVEDRRKLVESQSGSNSEIDSVSSTSSTDDGPHSPGDPIQRHDSSPVQPNPDASLVVHRPEGGDDGGANDLSSGSFVCPQCMLTLSSAESLQSHFESLHGSILATEDSDTCELINSCDNFAIENELKNAKESLLAERRYNTELRKEFERLRSTFLNHQQKSENLSENAEEVGYYLQQIQALEAGKSLVTSQLLEQEKIVAEVLRDLESLRKEKDFIVSKTIKMSKDTASMKSRWDEETEQKMALGEECVSLRDRVGTLQRMLDQRPSDDDVNVLQQELVNAQRAMDELTREREEELVTLRSQMMLIQDKCNQQEFLITSLTEQLSKNEIEEDPVQRSVPDAKSESASSAACAVLLSEVEKLKKDLEESKKGLTVTSELLDSKTKELSHLCDQKTAIEKELADAKSQLQESKSLNEDSEKRLVALTEERDAAILSLEESRFDTEKLQKSLDSSGKSQTAKQEQLEASLSETQVQLAERTKTLDAKTSEMLAVDQRFQKLETEFSAAQQEIGQLKLAKESAELQAVQLKQERDTTQDHMKELLNSQASSLEAKLNETVTALQGKMEVLSNDLVEKDKIILAKSEQLKLAEKELSSSKARVETLEAELVGKAKELNDVKEAAAKKSEKFHNEIASISAEKARLESDLSDREKELLTMRTQMTSAINGLNDKLTNQSAELAESRRRLEESETARKEHADQLNGKLKSVSEELEKERSAGANLSSLLAARENELQGAKESYAVVLKENNDRETYVKQQKTEIEKMIAEVSSQNVEKDSLNSTIHRLETELSASKSELETSRQEAAGLTADLEALQKNLSNLNLEKQKLESALAEMKKELDSATQQVQTTKAELVEGGLDVAKLRAELEYERNSNETKSNLAEKDMSKLKSHNEDLIAQVASLNLELSKAQDQIEIAQKEVETQKAELLSQISDLKAKLESASSNCSQLTEKHRLREGDLEDQLSTLGGSLAALRVELAEAKAVSSAVVEEKQALLDQIGGLKLQMQSFEEEKKSLMQRCLSLERDLEEEQDNMQEVRRRHDDALAAMHELGRENQSLQIDMSKHFNRRWADDAEVSNCSCGKAFSVTVRKHHCRNCGLIFCNECSEKLAPVASSKKKVRVCDNCFKDISAR